MNDFTIQELVILRRAMQDRIAVVENLASELGAYNLASKLLMAEYRCLQSKIIETLQRRTNGV